MSTTPERTLDDIALYNGAAWDKMARGGNVWSIPVSPEEVANARRGKYSVVLTPTKPVPSDWLGPLAGRRLLGLACGGGQQGPLFAAAGAHVTILDNSPEQLGRDRLVAERERLDMRFEEGDMRDLSRFGDESFDLVFHPVSNCFVPDIASVWTEAFRVLKPGGVLLAGFNNPIVYMLDLAREREGVVVLKYKAPFRSTDHADDPEIRAMRDAGEPMDFGHTLEAQIGGQIAAGFQIAGFYEDGWDASRSPLYGLMQCSIATRAVKPKTL